MTSKGLFQRSNESLRLLFPLLPLISTLNPFLRSSKRSPSISQWRTSTERRTRVDYIEEEDEVVGLYEDDLNAPLVDEEADDFGLQSEETNFAAYDGAEPQEALQLAKELGLASSEEALSKMGNSEKKTVGVISAYSALIEQVSSQYWLIKLETKRTSNTRLVGSTNQICLWRADQGNRRDREQGPRWHWKHFPTPRCWFWGQVE